MNAVKGRVAAVQMVSGPSVDANLMQAETLVGEAAARGASLVLLPENFGLISTRAADKLAAREPDGDGPQQAFLSRMASVHGIHVIGGSVPLESGDPQRVYQALLVYAPGGQRVARYDKIHLFRFTHGSEDYDEARTIRAGSSPQVLDAPLGRVGLSICYDVRFPELYRILAVRGARIVTIPAAFTVPTTRDHWEVLVRARAIEDQVFVIAPNQVGEHAEGLRSGGRSMIVDPWGLVLAQAADSETVITADLDLDAQTATRTRLPSLANRRPAAYRWPDA